MNLPTLFGFVLVLLLSNGTQAKSCKREPKCVLSRIHGMKLADCDKKDFKAIPQCLTTDVEIINLSYNRIRKIQKNDLSRYKYLRILYLSDNMVTSINEEAFNDLEDLATLDFTMNAIQKLPPVIFQLPSLKTLYLGQNVNMNIVDAVEAAKPINSPIWHLDISFLTEFEDAIEFPSFGIMPSLIKLNISGNIYYNLEPHHFAGLCQLQYLINNNVTADFGEECNCWTLNDWLSERKVRFTPFSCQIARANCLDHHLPPEDLASFQKCQKQIKEAVVKNRTMKILIGVGCALVVIVIILLICFLMRYNRRHKRVAKEKIAFQTKADLATLLVN